jgi:phenylalanyl-tRNA synthetase beta chain
LACRHRTVGFEIDLDALLAQEDLRAWDGALSTYPVSRQDVALIVDAGLPTQTLAATLREGAGEELELLETFDLYTGDQLPEGKKSLAFRLTFRAPDRTLKADEASAMREAATEVGRRASRRGSPQLRTVRHSARSTDTVVRPGFCCICSEASRQSAQEHPNTWV